MTIRFVGKGVAEPFEKSASSESTMSTGPRGGTSSVARLAHARSALTAARRAWASSGGVKWM